MRANRNPLPNGVSLVAHVDADDLDPLVRVTLEVVTLQEDEHFFRLHLAGLGVAVLPEADNRQLLPRSQLGQRPGSARQICQRGVGHDVALLDSTSEVLCFG